MRGGKFNLRQRELHDFPYEIQSDCEKIPVVSRKFLKVWLFSKD